MWIGVIGKVSPILVSPIVILGGAFAMGIATFSSLQLQHYASKKTGNGRRPCGACKGRGLYACKTCKAGGTVKWSPMYDPVFIHPCLCPTCDGLKVQHCLNCLGVGTV